MNNNRKLFQETFSELRASENRVMEVVNMKGTNKIRKFPAKKMLAIVACVCSLAAVGVVANAATDGALTKTVMGWFINEEGEKTEIEAVVSYDNDGAKVISAQADGFSFEYKEYTDGNSISLGYDGKKDILIKFPDGSFLTGKDLMLEYPNCEGIDMSKYIDLENGHICMEDGVYTETNIRGAVIKFTVKDNEVREELVKEGIPVEDNMANQIIGRHY